MAAQNCWEFMKCGREAGGAKVAQLGVCPAYSFAKADGFLGGKNGGRACAYITGTFCGGNVQGTRQDKEKHCTECEFFKMLKKVHRTESSVMRFNQYVAQR